MEETFIVVMQKNIATGFLEKELCTIKMEENDNYIVNVFAQDNQDEQYIYFKLSTIIDAEDWEYSAIFDYYDTDIFADDCEITEILDMFNPAWEVRFKYTNEEKSEHKITEILKKHVKELSDVYEIIKDIKDEY